MKPVNRKISKREFIRYGLYGVGGIASCLCGFPLFAKEKELHRGLQPMPPGLWKWSKESSWYEPTARGVRCLLCPNGCDLKKGDSGLCRSRVNENNKLYTIAYGNPCSVHTDPVEKKPLYHFLPGSRAFSIAAAGCNLACLNCQNWSISQASPYDTDNFDLMPQSVVDSCLKDKSESIAYTYSEPLSFYEYTLDTSKIARSRGVKNILKTSGYINEKPLRNLCRFIDAANVDLKSFSDAVYLKLNSGKLQPVLNTLKILKEEKIWLEITNLIIPNWTDDMNMIREMCRWLVKNGMNNSPLHFSRFYPVYKLKQLPSTPVETLRKAKNIALKEGMQYVYIGNVPGYDESNTYCHVCEKLLVERKGFSVVSNNIKDDLCTFCSAKIPGVWSK